MDLGLERMEIFQVPSIFNQCLEKGFAPLSICYLIARLIILVLGHFGSLVQVCLDLNFTHTLTK